MTSDRVAKGWRLFQRGNVKLVGDDVVLSFSVQSDTSNKKFYFVTIDKKSWVMMCTCEDYAYSSAKLLMSDDGCHIGSFLCGHMYGSIFELGKVKGSGQVEFV